METMALRCNSAEQHHIPIKPMCLCHRSKFNWRTRVSPHTTGTNVIQPLSRFSGGAFWALHRCYEAITSHIADLRSALVLLLIKEGFGGMRLEMIMCERSSSQKPHNLLWLGQRSCLLGARVLLTPHLNCFSVNKAAHNSFLDAAERVL